MARVDWSAATQGRRVIPALLVHGLPAVFFPEGYTDVASTSYGVPDALWWPGSSASTLATYAKPWFGFADGSVAWTERASPGDSTRLDIASLTLRIADVGYAATELFASRDLALGTFITTEVTSSATTIHVVSTAGFPSSGVAYLGREAFEYTSVTSTTFAGCTRGRFGSQAQRHFYSASAGFGLGNPEVTDRPVEVVGRLATLWLLEITADDASALSLQYVGHIGGGPLLADDGDAFTLQVDHALKRLSQSPRAPTVTIGGYSHTGNTGGRGPFVVDGVTTYGRNLTRDGLTPVADTFNTDVGGGTGLTEYVFVLTDDAGAPDNGGWHPTREAYVEALNTAVDGVIDPGDSATYTLDAHGRLHLTWTWANPRGGRTAWAFSGVPLGYTIEPTTTFDLTSEAAMPEAWVPIVGGSRIYLSDTDYATVPPVPAQPSDASVYWALAWDEQAGEGADPVRRVVRVLGNDSTSGVNYLRVSPVNGGTYVPPSQRIAPDSVLRRRQGFLVTTPTTARLALYVSADSWVPALRNAVTVFSDDLGDSAAQVFDWPRIEAMAALYAPTIRGHREYAIDADTTVLDLVANECALQGFALVPYQGRIAVARIADYAASETRAAELTSADFAAAGTVPAYSRARDGIVNTMLVTFPAAKTTFNFVDQTSRAAFGPSRSKVEVTVPAGLLDRAVDGAAMASTVAALAMNTLGPLRAPYETVDVTLTLRHAELAVGDLVGLTSWRVPDGAGARGLASRTAQVVERAPVLYRDAHEGLVRFVLRLSPNNLCGWAPGAAVASISGTAVTLNTTSFGASGCAQEGTDGGASTFAAGDKVRLIQALTASPTTAIQREVASVAGAVVTLTVAPGATWEGLAGSPLQVLMLYDDWDVVVDAQLPGWAYLADADNLLVDGGTSTAARRYA